MSSDIQGTTSCCTCNEMPIEVSEIYDGIRIPKPARESFLCSS